MMKEHTMIFERLWKDYSKRLNGCGDDYTATCMLDYPYFKKHYKMIETDLGKKQMLINNKRLMLIQKQYKKLMLNLDRASFWIFTRNCENMVNLFYFNVIPL